MIDGKVQNGVVSAQARIRLRPPRPTSRVRCEPTKWCTMFFTDRLRPAQALHSSPRCLSDHWIGRGSISSQRHRYGYNVNELAMVGYLLVTERSKTQHLFRNYWDAITIAAQNLPSVCGHTVCASRIWTCRSNMAFIGTSMGDNIRTLEDDKKPKNLEQKLTDLKLVATPELEVLCSCTYRFRLEEPFDMGVLPPPEWPFGGGEEIFWLT